MPPIEIRRLLPGDDGLLDTVAPDIFDAPIEPADDEGLPRLAGDLIFVALDDGRDVAQATAMIHRHPDKPTGMQWEEAPVPGAKRARR